MDFFKINYLTVIEADSLESAIRSFNGEVRSIVKLSEHDTLIHRIANGETMEIGEEKFLDWLNAVPPIRQTYNSFYMGEPYDHRGKGGRARFFYCFVKDGKYLCRLQTVQPK